MWIIVAYQDARPLVVNLTTMRPSSDRSAVFGKGDHPWLRWDSVAYFAGITDFDEDKILAAVKAKKISLQPRVSPAVRAKLIAGAARSPHTPIRLQSFFKRLVEPEYPALPSGERAEP